MKDGIGAKLRTFRKARRLTLNALAEAAGCTGALISQIEKGQTSPSITMLKNIADALSVNIVEFFDGTVGEDQVVSRLADRRLVSVRRWDAKMEQLVSSTQGKLMQPFLTTIAPGGGSRESYQHPGQEFGFVLKGVLTINVGGEIYKLNPTEVFYYSSVIPHSWVNEGDEEVQVVWVVCPPNL